MKTYIVGGAVRDGLLGLPVQDRDHVVIGATPDDMVARGYTPVGKDFPVFLHPVTHEEYALARTERKTAPGYKGFVFHAAPDVALEEDLIRRDLTVNAMAQDESGAVIDPFHGQRDLQARVFRHVSDAFAEDPVRILRVARFAARFTDFTVAPETNRLMRHMVASGEVDALVPERVWQELSRGLMEQRPSRMFVVLHDCGALAPLLPELHALWSASMPDRTSTIADRVMGGIDLAASRGSGLPVRCAILLQFAGATAAERACKRLKMPNDCRELTILAAREHAQVGAAHNMSPDALVSLFERCDAFRKPQRFYDLVEVEDCIHAVMPHDAHAIEPPPFFIQASTLRSSLDAARAVDAGAIARQCASDPKRISAAVHQARVDAVRHALGA